MGDLGGVWLQVRAKLDTFRTDVQTGIATSLQGVSANVPVTLGGTAGAAKSDNVENQVALLKQRITKAIEYAGIGATIDLGTKLVVGGVEDYAAEQQAIAATKKQFGEYSDSVLQLGDKSAQSMGLTKTAALDMTNQFGLLFQSVGEGQKQAAEDSTNWSQRVVDIAAATHKSVDQVNAIFDTAFKGGARGLIGLHTLGIDLTTQQLQSDAVKLGLGTTTVDTAKVAQLQDKITSLKDQITKAKQNIHLEPRILDEANNAIRIAQTNVDKTVVGTEKHQSALDALAHAQDKYNALVLGASPAADALKSKQDQLTKAEQDLAAAKKGTIDVTDPAIRQAIIAKEALAQTGKDKGAFETSPEGSLQRLQAAAGNAKAAFGEGLYPELTKLSDWATEHKSDLENFAQNAGQDIGTAVSAIGNTVGFIDSHWSVIKPFLETFVAAFALDHLLGWGKTLLGFLSQAGATNLMDKWFPNLSKALGGNTPAIVKDPNTLAVENNTVATSANTDALIRSSAGNAVGNAVGAGETAFGEATGAYAINKAGKAYDPKTGQLLSADAVYALDHPGFGSAYVKNSAGQLINPKNNQFISGAEAAAADAALIASRNTAVAEAATQAPTIGKLIGIGVGGLFKTAIDVYIAKQVVDTVNSIGQANGYKDIEDLHTYGIGGFGGNASDLTNIQQDLGALNNIHNGWGGALARGLPSVNQLAQNELGNPALLKAVQSDNYNAIAGVSAFLSKNVEGSGPVADEWLALAEAVRDGNVRSQASLNLFLANYGQNTDTVNVNMAQYAQDINTGRIKWDAAVAKSISEWSSVHPDFSQRAIDLLFSGINKGPGHDPTAVSHPVTIGGGTPSLGGNTGPVSIGGGTPTFGTTGAGSGTNGPPYDTGGWLFHPEPIVAGHGPMGEGVFRPDQVLALHALGIERGRLEAAAPTQPPVVVKGGDNIHVYNPTSDVHVMQAIRRQRYLTTLENTGVEPAPTWPQY